MRIVEIVERYVFESHRFRFVAWLLALSALRSGIWQMPNLDASRRLAEDPFVNPFSTPETHYLMWNWLGPWLAYLVGATGSAAFFVFHFGFAIAFSGLVAWLCFKRLKERNARVALILFALLPVSSTAYYWVGMDAITLFLMVLSFLIPTNPLWPLAIGALLGMQHFEQGLVAAVLLCVVVVMRTRLKLPNVISTLWCCALTFGVLAGKLILIEVFQYVEINVAIERGYWIQKLLPTLLRQLFTDFHYLAWSVLALGWIVLVKDIQRGKAVIPVLLGLVGAMSLLGLVFDQTRVVAIVSFPLLWVSWLQDNDFLDKLENRFIAWMTIAWLIVPWAWVFGGRSQRSVLPFDLAVVVGTLTGWYELPRDLEWWPFWFDPP
jgi:hypothetical protein